MIFTVLGFVQLILAWALFAPVQLGGNTAYVILIGNSMEPQFKRGDLVLVRETKHYQVGDAVAYQHPEIGTVFHRIVGEALGRFTLQGDNNYWLDSHQPVQDEIIGKLWIHLPNVGSYIQTIRTPRNFTLSVLSIIGSILFLGSSKSSRKPSANRGNNMFTSKFNPIEWLVLLSILGLGAVLLAIKSFTSPNSEIIDNQVAYTHHGNFSYTADVPAGVYDGDVIRAGEPVYRQVTDEFVVQFEYSFNASQTAQLQGIYRMVAEISNPKGWKRTLELLPVTEFSGTSFETSAIVNFSQVQAFIDMLEEQTGIRRGMEYTLNIRPEIYVEGRLAEKEIAGNFTPSLAFTFDELAVSMVQDSLEENPLSQSSVHMTSYAREMPNTLSLLGLELSVPFARALSLVGIMVYVYGLVMLAIQVNSAKQLGEISRINMMYGHKIVTIADVTFTQNQVQVDSIDELAKIAEQNQKVIMHLNRADVHYYFVQSYDVTYLYQLILNNDVRMLPPMD